MQNQAYCLAVLTIIQQESASCVIEYGRACPCNPTDKPYATFNAHFSSIWAVIPVIYV